MQNKLLITIYRIRIILNMQQKSVELYSKNCQNNHYGWHHCATINYFNVFLTKFNNDIN